MMGLKISKEKKRRKIKKIDLISEGSEYAHMNVPGKITFDKDADFDIPQVEIRFENYFPVIVRLWTLGQERQQFPAPTVSLDSGIDQAP